MTEHAALLSDDEKQKAFRLPFAFRFSSIVSVVWSPVSLLLLLCLPALWPMWLTPYWASHDGLHHIFRLMNFDAGLRSGVLYPRWADQLGFGYGFPVTNYYAPLAYYIAEMFHLLGAGFLDSLKLTYVLGFIISGLSMFWLARDFVQPRAAVLAALLYAYYPYHIADVYMRGTLTEFMALTIMPLIVWSVRRAIALPTPGMPLRWSHILFSATLLAALILTHNLSAFLFLPALAVYVFLVSMQRDLRNNIRTWLVFASLAVIAFALAAFYWLPAIGEKDWIRAGQVSSSVDEIQTLLTPISQFFSTALLQPYVPDAPAQLQHPLNLFIALTSAAAITVGLSARTRFSADQRREWLRWLLIALLSLFAMLDWSAPLWANIRPLAFVQFPYRLHAILGLALAMLIGLGVQASSMWRNRKLVLSPSAPLHPRRALHAPRKAGPGTWINSVEGSQIANRKSQFAIRILSLSHVRTSLMVAVLIASSLGALNIVPQTLPGHKEPIGEAQVNLSGMSEYDYQTALWARLYGGPWLLEYLPVWVTEGREEFFLPRSSPLERAGWGPAPQLEVQQYRSEQRVLRVRSAESFPLSFHTFYFPAWQVRVDGQAVPTFPSGPLALVGAEVPAGEHQVTLSFESTPLQRIGEIISTLALIALLISAWLRARYKKFWLSLTLLLLVGVLGWRSLDIRMAEGPRPLAATFDNQIDLIGYESAHDVYQPGDVLEVTLYWFARQTPAEDFKVFVHLDGANGRAGQVDAQPGFNFSPTTRWQRGELIADHYRLKISPNAVPGSYEIFTGMYRQQPLRNLSVVSEWAVPGDRVRLGQIEIR